MKKMTEDDVVMYLAKYLKKEGWEILNQCTVNDQGIDIEAVKDDQTLLIEAKGAKGTKKNTRKPFFDKSQIRTHFGVAIVTIMELKTKFPNAALAIAQPDDELIKTVLEDSIGHLEDFGIEHYWVSNDGTVRKKYLD